VYRLAADAIEQICGMLTATEADQEGSSGQKREHGESKYLILMQVIDLYWMNYSNEQEYMCDAPVKAASAP